MPFRAGMDTPLNFLSKPLCNLCTLISGLLVVLIENRIYRLIKLLLYTTKKVTETKLQKIHLFT